MWSCRKQDIVALSSAEAEYVALTDTCKELIWIRRVAKGFGVAIDGPMKVYTDSQSAMAMCTNQKFSHRTKHIDTKYYFIKDMVDKGQLNLEYHPTETNIADLMTKLLGSVKMEVLRRLAGMQK
jgi:hypothetical protein